MKKTFLSIAILASSILAFAATNTPVQSSPSASTEQTAPAKQHKDKKNDKKASRNGGSADERRIHGDRLFEGLNLTDNQKERIAALKDKNKADRDAAKKDGKERNENLTPEQRKQMKTERTRAFLADVKEILTPEQYVTFLENSFSLGGRDHKMHKGGKDGHKGHSANTNKHDRKGATSQKGGKTEKNRS